MTGRHSVSLRQHPLRAGKGERNGGYITVHAGLVISTCLEAANAFVFCPEHSAEACPRLRTFGEL